MLVIAFDWKTVSVLPTSPSSRELRRSAFRFAVAWDRHSITRQAGSMPFTVWDVAFKFHRSPPARKAKPFSQRRTLLAQQLLFRSGQFLQFCFSSTFGYARSARVSYPLPPRPPTPVTICCRLAPHTKARPSVAVSGIISSYFCNRPTKLRSFASLDENFQFCGSSIRSRNRRFCSFFETCRKNFGTTTPFLEVLVEIADVSSNRSSQIFCLPGQLLFCQEFRMHPHDEHLFIAAIKGSTGRDWQVFHAAPEVIVIQVLGRGRFKRIDLAALWIYARHDMLYSAILAERRPLLERSEACPVS